VVFPGEASRAEIGVVVACLLLTVMYLLVAPGAAGQARFRVAAEPSLALLAGMGAVLWGEALAKHRVKKATKAAANST
jgi:asparagine N-glycosylation enzyme membrane subunit Stt3